MKNRKRMMTKVKEKNKIFFKNLNEEKRQRPVQATTQLSHEHQSTLFTFCDSTGPCEIITTKKQGNTLIIKKQHPDHMIFMPQSPPFGRNKLGGIVFTMPPQQVMFYRGHHASLRLANIHYGPPCILIKYASVK